MRPPSERKLWTTTETAAFLDVPLATLRHWRYVGIGPAAFKVGRFLRYDPDEVWRWLREECSRKRSA
jgi:helix-turn-helix protein